MRLVIFLCLTVLTGCGGGSSGSADLDDMNVDVIPKTAVDGLGPDPNSASVLPMTGTARYAGTITLGLERAGAAPGERTSLIGDLTVDVDFAGTAAQVTGFASELSNGGTPIDGDLYLTLGMIDRAAAETDPTFSGTASASLKEGTEAYLLYGRFSGNFRGENQSVVDGVVYGNVRNGSNQTLFDGTFQAGQ